MRMSTSPPYHNILYNADQKTRREQEAERFAQFTEPTDLRAALHVKVHSLRVEAQLIRKKEKEHPRGHVLRMYLAQHRKTIVRREARASQLALCFLRGRAYSSVEPFVHPGGEPDWYAVQRNVARFGYLFRTSLPHDEQYRLRELVMEDYKKWMSDGVLYLAQLHKPAAPVNIPARVA